jgi:hypothetical protein
VGADADRLKATAADRKAYLAELKQIEITLPTITFDRSAVLHKKGREIQLLYFGRGHTRGDTVVYLPREKVLIGGDLLTAGIPFARDAYPAEWADTLAQVAKLDIQKIVPGHGGVKDGRKLVEDRVGFLRDLVAQVKKGWSEGKDAKAIQAGLDVASGSRPSTCPRGRRSRSAWRCSSSARSRKRRASCASGSPGPLGDRHVLAEVDVLDWLRSFTPSAIGRWNAFRPLISPCRPRAVDHRGL